MAHTKGNWTYFKNHKGAFLIDTEFGNIAEVFSPEDATIYEAEANAKLMSAAPEMLEALKDAKEYLKRKVCALEDRVVWEKVNNAIKKAI